MVQINFAKREVQCKVVFYGPARSGKTANLRAIHAMAARGTISLMKTTPRRDPSASSRRT